MTRPKNKVQHIQGLLFANQFVSYDYNTQSDRQLRVDGGMVGKQIMGRYISFTGPERTYAAGSSFAPAQDQIDNVSLPAMTPALIVKEDPRFQYQTQFLDVNFGQVLLSY